MLILASNFHSPAYEAFHSFTPPSAPVALTTVPVKFHSTSTPLTAPPLPPPSSPPSSASNWPVHSPPSSPSSAGGWTRQTRALPSRAPEARSWNERPEAGAQAREEVGGVWEATAGLREGVWVRSGLEACGARGGERTRKLCQGAWAGRWNSCV